MTRESRVVNQNMPLAVAVYGGFTYPFSLGHSVKVMSLKSCTVLLFTWMFCAGALKCLASGIRSNGIIFSWIM